MALAAAAFAGACSAPSEWHDAGTHRWRELRVRGVDRALLTRLDGRRTGIRFRNDIDDSTLLSNRALANGSGVALGDYDGDGLTDVFFAAINGDVRLYRNRGRWQFEDVTARAGIERSGHAHTGAVFADVDGDRDLDLLLAAVGAPLTLYRNGGGGGFHRSESEAGLGANEGGTTLALADTDGDGDLDLYVANYKRRLLVDSLPQSPTFDQVVRRTEKGLTIAPGFEKHYRLVLDSARGIPIRTERAEPDWFYENDGQGRFQSVSFTGSRFLGADGLRLRETPAHFGLAARFHDVNGDGAPDLYVCNDFEDPDALWMNDGKGNFKAIAASALRTTSFASMGVDFSDVDRDGDSEIFVVDMLSRDSRRRKSQESLAAPLRAAQVDNAAVLQIPQNTLQLNHGDGTFSQIADAAGVSASDWSWTPMFLDADLDGYEDLFVTAGYEWDAMNADILDQARRRPLSFSRKEELALFPKLAVPNSAFRNNGNLTFTEESDSWGFDPEPAVSHGMAAADLDNDGDLDLVVNRWRQEAAIYRNDAQAPRVAVRLIGRAPNTQGIGARISVAGGPVPLQTREVTSGGHYLSGSDPVATFAAGDAADLELRVRWRGGGETVIQASPNRFYEIREPAPAAHEAQRSPRAKATAFADVSAQLNHVHTDRPFDDYARQPLLPASLARRGPGIAWFDYDSDGDEDLFITGGTGGQLAAFQNGNGRLRRVSAVPSVSQHDQLAVLGSHSSAGAAELLVASSNYELGGGVRPLEPLAAVSRLDGTLKTAVAASLPDSGSIGAIALADVDGDGDLDMFVGAHSYPGKYPRSPGSALYIRDGSRFTLSRVADVALRDVGLVSAAVFSDVDQDGDPDLLLAQEWSHIRLLRNDRGVFSDVSREKGLDRFTSRWNGVATGDLNGDGAPDIIATSWGTNTGMHATPDRPLLLYSGDFDHNGTHDVVLARHDEQLGVVAPLATLSRLTHGVPAIRRRVGTFERFAGASVDAVLGPFAREASRLSASTLEHMVFLSRAGGGYDARPLPPVAQLSPAFFVGVADYDADGNEDIFLAQNFFATPIDEHRLDAGTGLWLKGDGMGGLTAVPASESGIRVNGEQRSAGLSDFDQDGRVDLVVSQNAGPSKLYRNTSPVRGLRVRLAGPPANPSAIGATLIPLYGAQRGPSREIQAGSGYASHNGAIQVLGARERISELVVRWPGGGTSTVPVPPGQTEMTIRRLRPP